MSVDLLPPNAVAVIYYFQVKHVILGMYMLYLFKNIAIVTRSQQDVHYLGGAFVGHAGRPLRQRLCIFMQGFL